MVWVIWIVFSIFLVFLALGYAELRAISASIKDISKILENIDAVLTQFATK